MEAIVAIIGGVFLVITTNMNRKTSKRLKTQNGVNVGEYVEKTHFLLGEMNGKLDAHINDKESHS